jgi:hypothetical protein
MCCSVVSWSELVVLFVGWLVACLPLQARDRDLAFTDIRFINFWSLWWPVHFIL